MCHAYVDLHRPLHIIEQYITYPISTYTAGESEGTQLLCKYLLL